MTQICLVGKLGQDPDLIKIAQGFHIPVCFSETGEEFLSDKLCITYFIVDEFDGLIFDHLWKMECRFDLVDFIYLRSKLWFYLQFLGYWGLWH